MELGTLTEADSCVWAPFNGLGDICITDWCRIACSLIRAVSERMQKKLRLIKFTPDLHDFTKFSLDFWSITGKLKINPKRIYPSPLNLIISQWCGSWSWYQQNQTGMLSLICPFLFHFPYSALCCVVWILHSEGLILPSAPTFPWSHAGPIWQAVWYCNSVKSTLVLSNSLVILQPGSTS